MFDIDHVSRWGGIPQEKLNENNRKHIEVLCRGFGLGPWNIPVKWNNVEFGMRYTSFVLASPQFATYDNDRLTRLVVFAHDECLRMEISPKTFRHLEITFWSGRTREGGLMQRHPTIEDAVYEIRNGKRKVSWLSSLMKKLKI